LGDLVAKSASEQVDGLATRNAVRPMDFFNGRREVRNTPIRKQPSYFSRRFPHLELRPRAVADTRWPARVAAITAHLEKGDRYFYFHGGDAADWLDRTIRVPTLSALTLEQWVQEFYRLQKLNAQIMRSAGAAGSRAAVAPSHRPTKRKRA
jgi:hypothetical protein